MPMEGRHGTLVRGIPAQRRHRNHRVEEAVTIKGGFRFDRTDGSWWWSPGMFLLHGYDPDRLHGVVPSMRLLLAHRHPADRQALADAWAHLVGDGRLVAFRHRVVGADGVIRPVFTVASTGHGRDACAVTGVMQLDLPPR